MQTIRSATELSRVLACVCCAQVSLDCWKALDSWAHRIWIFPERRSIQEYYKCLHRAAQHWHWYDKWSRSEDFVTYQAIAEVPWRKHKLLSKCAFLRAPAFARCTLVESSCPMRFICAGFTGPARNTSLWSVVIVGCPRRITVRIVILHWSNSVGKLVQRLSPQLTLPVLPDNEAEYVIHLRLMK